MDIEVNVDLSRAQLSTILPDLQPRLVTGVYRLAS